MEEARSGISQEFEKKISLIRKKKFTFFLIRLGIVLFVFLLLAGYLLTPLSTISNYSLNGNINYTIDDIYEFTGNRASTEIFNIDVSDTEEKLLSHPLISDAEVSISPFSFNVTIKENAPSCYFLNDVYALDGKTYSEETKSSEDYISYMEKYGKNLPQFTENPSNTDGKYFSDYMYLTTMVNHEEKLLDFVQDCVENRNFKFYYKVNSIYYYLCVKLTYSEDFTSEEYISSLRLSQSDLEKVASKINPSSVKTLSVTEGEISYAEVNLSLIPNGNLTEKKFSF